LRSSSCPRNAGDRAAEDELATDWALYLAVERGEAERFRCWQAARPVVVLGRHGDPRAEIHESACAADDVQIVRRFSGGGTVVLGPGCLNYVVALSLVSRPELADVAGSFRFVLRAIVTALKVPGLSAVGTDLAVNGRKVSGNAQRRGRRAMVHHGTLLYDFDPALAARYLKEPVRQPAYRAARRHGDFLGNLPLSRDVLCARLEAVWRSLSRDGDVWPRHTTYA
jgi:lipoate-protein ligase A